MTWGSKNMQAKFEQGSLSNWCDADANSSKTICRQPPMRGQHNKKQVGL